MVERPVHRRDLARLVADRLDIASADADRVVSETFDAIADELAHGHDVIVRGFGVFEARQMRPVTRRRPDTGEAVEVGPRKKPAFRASRALKDSLNRGDEHA